jgi:hypothetical protein
MLVYTSSDRVGIRVSFMVICFYQEIQQVHCSRKFYVLW